MYALLGQEENGHELSGEFHPLHGTLRVLTSGTSSLSQDGRPPILSIRETIRREHRPPQLGIIMPLRIQERVPDGIEALFGPAYKDSAGGIGGVLPYRNYGRDLPYCFNRKEVKDHGEGG